MGNGRDGRMDGRMDGPFFLVGGMWGGGNWLRDCDNVGPGFPQVKFVQEDVLHFHGGPYDRVVQISEW